MRWIFPDRLAAAMAGWFGRFPAQTTVIEAPIWWIRTCPGSP